MKVTREQLLELLASGAPEGAVWVYHEDKTTEIVEAPTVDELDELRSSASWPMYLIRVDHAENYIRQHATEGSDGLDGAVQMLNLTFSLLPEPHTAVARAAAITGRLLGRRKRQRAQEESI